MRRMGRGSLVLAVLLAFLPVGSIGAKAVEQVNMETKISLKIDVDVGEDGCNSASYHAGEVHTWIIRSSVPADIADANAYEVTDSLDQRLTLEPDSLVVTLHTGGNKKTKLIQDAHYLLSEVYGIAGDPGNRDIVVTLTREGMAFAGKLSGFTESQLEITFRASINSRGGVGESISNMAKVRYADPMGTVFSSESDRPEVHTGGIVIRKTDSAGNPLAGAKFRIAKASVELGKDMLILEEAVIPVTYQPFHSTRDMSEGKVMEVETDENGTAVMYGLAYGTYYIVESAAPEGYNLLTQPIAVVIDSASHLTEEDGWKDTDGRIVDNSVRVVNTKFLLPNSGGPGKEVYMVAGLWIMGAAVILLLMNIRWRRILQ